MNPVEATGSGVLIRVHLQPRASRHELVGLHGDALKIRIAAPPVDGAANEALIRFLAEQLGVAVSAVEITSGLSGRRKTVRVHGVTAAEARARLERG